MEKTMQIKEYCQKLKLDNNLSQLAIDWINNNEDLCKKYSAFLLKNQPAKLKKLDNIAKLAIVIYSLENTRHNYQKLGIDETIFWDTMSDIAIWCKNDYERYGKLGLDNIHWIAKHLSMRIFRLGRLQFEFARFMILPHAKLKDIIKCPYRLGEKCITLHIPQGEKLDKDLCQKSFEKANEFFAKFYPDYKYRCYTVITWLVNPHLKNVLAKDSNIVAFGNLFKLLGKVSDDDMNERRIFGYKKDRSSYKPTNALQAYTLARIKSKKHLYSYMGYMAK